MGERYLQHGLPNGMTLLVESMPEVQSAAMALLVPVGGAGDPVDRSGSASVLSDLVLRGAGGRDAQQLTEYLDGLGLRRSSGVNIYHTAFRSAALAGNVIEALGAYADIVQRPTMPQGGFKAARDLALQSLAGLEDDPRQKLLVKLHEWHLPSPYGRNVMGEAGQLQKLSLDLCKADWNQRCHPKGAILAVAGGVDFGQVRDAVEKHFGAWSGPAPRELSILPPPGRQHHETQRSEQTHIGIGMPSIPETHADYYIVRLAMEVLSGGMSGRLFTEVREKRGLCYSVWAGYSGYHTFGAIFGYAGTSNDRAQATLDCFIDELHRFTKGITAEELERAKTGLKASTIMQGESSSARAGAIAHDYFMRGRIRTLDEIKDAINSVTLDAVNDYLKTHPPGPFTIVTVGPKELRID